MDGAAGAPDAAPFDRVQATVGVWDIATADFLSASGATRLGRLLKEEPTVTEAVSDLPRGWFPSLALRTNER